MQQFFSPRGRACLAAGWLLLAAAPAGAQSLQVPARNPRTQPANPADEQPALKLIEPGQFVSEQARPLPATPPEPDDARLWSKEPSWLEEFGFGRYLGLPTLRFPTLPRRDEDAEDAENVPARQPATVLQEILPVVAFEPAESSERSSADDRDRFGPRAAGHCPACRPKQAVAEKKSSAARCPDCKPCSKCRSQESIEELKEGEAARLILELMDSIGRSVLDGTVFQKPDPAVQEWLREIAGAGPGGTRDALVRYIRALEAEAREQNAECESRRDAPACDSALASCPPQPPLAPLQFPVSSPCPATDTEVPLVVHEWTSVPGMRISRTAAAACTGNPSCPSHAEGEVHLAPTSVTPQAITTLRDAAERLDYVANALEQQELYDEADGVRHLAGELREQARWKSGAFRTSWSQPSPCCSATTCVHNVGIGGPPPAKSAGSYEALPCPAAPRDLPHPAAASASAELPPAPPAPPRALPQRLRQGLEGQLERLQQRLQREAAARKAEQDNHAHDR